MRLIDASEGAQVVRYIDLPSALRVEILARDNI